MLSGLPKITHQEVMELDLGCKSDGPRPLSLSCCCFNHGKENTGTDQFKGHCSATECSHH